MKTSETTVNEIVICDSVSVELHKLRLLQTFLSQVIDTSLEDGVQFIGRWNVSYFDSAVMALMDTIDNIEEIIHPQKDGTN